MALEQDAHVALRPLPPCALERTLAQVHDERVVAEHVAKARLHGAHAEVVLLAVAVPNAGSKTPIASISARRTQKQKPTPVGSSGYVGTAARASAARVGSGSASSGQALFTQNRGNEQISALFENGVIVPMRGSAAAQRRSASSQPAVTMVSELSSTTSSRAMPQPAVGRRREPEVGFVRAAGGRAGGGARRARRTEPRSPGRATRRRSAGARSRRSSARARWPRSGQRPPARCRPVSRPPAWRRFYPIVRDPRPRADVAAR